ncbi:DUF4488 domain-containing protein [Wenyingzhuangia marina]|uniref:DUF4488 domain-containing protein n=1 Tax=Wenyingzhuangia marina TaxID=1195760 RepID=A0A1M5S612_9FLAO|nr:DUF4488 domain-containing protein [Wenyingzhuangia marina]GGF78830.1 hypothetical protein GCM10011397_22360 [Wenyingzhuangia marina]SHH33373.1 protein of unknown function [Wenyingzhuangia marina]
MKNIFISFTIVFSILTTISCSSIKKTKTEKTHLPISKSLVGLWRQTIPIIKDGKTTNLLTPHYKSINTDGTYYTFNAPGNGNTKIIQYGSYEITSDNTYIEHVITNSAVPTMSNQDSSIKFKLVDENTLIINWKLKDQRGGTEKWTRVLMMD